MKPWFVLSVALICLLADTLPVSAATSEKRFPYEQFGLTARQAAAHLLERLTYGPRPGEIEQVVQMGLETWFERQLAADQDSPRLQEALAPLEAVRMSAQEIAQRYPNPGQILRLAIQDGVIDRADSSLSDRQRREILRTYMERRGFRPLRELMAQLMAQKILRAVYSENQLVEVLTDFWFNHFNVSLTDNACRPFILSYERDAIRPHVVGRFRELLGATARHPAMLLYLDNAQSTASDTVATTMDMARQAMRARARRSPLPLDRFRRSTQTPPGAQNNRRRGINENYARELLELHTLGVDGGYTQQDVIEVARAFTGWTVYPMGPQRERLQRRLQRAQAVGFVNDGLFLFRADAHDAGPKTILGQHFPAGGGVEEGERVLDIVALHPSTARHLAQKLAARFVADDPPPGLVERLAATFLTTAGDLKMVLRELVYSPEFWDPAYRAAKIKTPFELAVSALRALDASVRPSRQLVDWIARMGQPLYGYQAPTGYPDRADFWVNAGSLLNRMNFAMALALHEIRGVRFDLQRWLDGREPASRQEALEICGRRLLPERDLSRMLEQLRKLVDDPQYHQKLAQAAGTDSLSQTLSRRELQPGESLAQVVGLILGSPEFQRH